MLIQPLYLDTSTLPGLLALVEGGVRKAIVMTDSDGSTFGGGIGWGGLGVNAKKEATTSSETTFADHDVARLGRLLQHSERAAEQLGWLHVAQPETDLAGVGFGAFVEWECDVYVPDMVKLFHKSGGMLDALNTLDQLMPMAKTFGFDMDGIPPADQRQAFRNLAENFDAPMAIVGEDQDGSEWKVVGVLREEFIVNGAEFEGPMRVIGKVRKVVREGAWTPLMTLPGMNLLSRDERRKQERTKPTEQDQDNYLAGPALVLDILAVYR